MEITERTTSSILTSSSSQIFSNVYLFIHLIFENILIYFFNQYLLHILMESFYEKRPLL